MILNVIKEGENTSNNTSKLDLIIKENSKVDNVQLKRIKELLNEKDLKYVSENVRQLLDITIQNDPSCFVLPKDRIKKIIQSGEQFRVILYVRLSQEDGDLDDGDVSGSIKNQLLLLLEECRKRNWLVVGIFCEEDISGVDDNRPEWLKSIRFAECGNTEIVVCKSQSRFTRSMEMVEKYLHKCFPEWNVRFVGLVDNTDTNNVANKKSRQINGLVNEWYVEDASINTKAALNAMKRNGQFVGSFPPYGYLIDPNDKHHLIPDEYAKGAIKIMIGMLKHGKSMNDLIDVLMRKGYKTPADYKVSIGYKIYRGKGRIKSIRYQVEEGESLKSIAYKFYVTIEEIKQLNNLTSNQIKENDVLIIPYYQRWTGQMIRKILTDETQIGTLVQGKTERISFKNKKEISKDKDDWIRVPHCHEANMDLETFEYFQKVFEPKKNYRAQKNGEMPLFSKKVYCMYCGKAFYKNTSKSKKSCKTYLQCKSRATTKDHVCDNTQVIDYDFFKKYILEKIKEKINEYYNLTKVSKEYYLQNIYANIDRDIEQLQKEKIKIENDIQNKKDILIQIYNDKVSGNLSEMEFSILKNSNTLEIERLNNRIIEIDSEINNLKADKENQIDKEQLFEKYKNIKELDKVVLDAFISKIEIGRVNKENLTRPINIKWNLYIN